MALRDQPYLPLYVDDFLSDEKLNLCSANSHGVYIKIMCLMHKSETYGIILLDQKWKQNDNQIINFANKFAKILPFTFDEILSALSELVYERVLYIEGDQLIQKRMVRDNEISIIRAEAGYKGGKSTQFAKANNEASATDFAKANIEASTVYANVNVNTIDSLGKESVREKPITWKTNYEIYKTELDKVYAQLLIDPNFITEREKFHPNLDIPLSLEKAYTDFWGTEAGWKHKKKSRSNDIDWKSTLTKALDLKSNQVYKPYGSQRATIPSTIETRKQQENYGIFKPGDEPGTKIISIR